MFLLFKKYFKLAVFLKTSWHRLQDWSRECGNVCIPESRKHLLMFRNHV